MSRALDAINKEAQRDVLPRRRLHVFHARATDCNIALPAFAGAQDGSGLRGIVNENVAPGPSFFTAQMRP
jgi:hypothetical protein